MRKCFIEIRMSGLHFLTKEKSFSIGLSLTVFLQFV